MDVSDNELESAAVDVYDLMRWTPAFGIDLADGSDRAIRQADVLGRAIAWQAAYRARNSPLDLLEDRELSSVSIGSYSESYADGRGSRPIVANRVRDLLAGAGLMRLAGTSSRGGRSPEMIPVEW